MTNTDYAITGTRGKIEKRETRKTVLAFILLFVALAITSTVDTNKSFGKSDLNGTGKDYSVKISNTNIGFYTDKHLFSFGGGNRDFGFTTGIDNGKLFGNYHIEAKCYGNACE